MKPQLAAPRLFLLLLLLPLSACVFPDLGISYYHVRSARSWANLERSDGSYELEIKIDGRAHQVRYEIEAPAEGGELRWVARCDGEILRQGVERGQNERRVLNFPAHPGRWTLHLELSGYSGSLKARIHASDRDGSRREV